jgi:hypothetical protein
MDVDEGTIMDDLKSRKGSTVVPTLRSMWVGGSVGQSNAQAETSRKLSAGQYTIGLTVGIQIGHSDTLLNDERGGLSQRFLWFSTTDPGLPSIDDLPHWPGPLDWDEADPGPLAYPLSVIRETKEKRHAVTTGAYVPGPYEEHRNLVQLKVAALLAILNKRDHVSLDDWKLASMVVEASDAVRLTAVDEVQRLRTEERAKRSTETAHANLVQEDVINEGRTERIARSIARHVHQHHFDCTRKCTRTSLHSPDRGGFDDALALAIQRGWVTSDLDPGERPPEHP